MDTLAGHVIRNASVKASSQSGINPILGNPIHSLRPGGYTDVHFVSLSYAS